MTGFGHITSGRLNNFTRPEGPQVSDRRPFRAEFLAKIYFGRSRPKPSKSPTAINLGPLRGRSWRRHPKRAQLSLLTMSLRNLLSHKHLSRSHRLLVRGPTCIMVVKLPSLMHLTVRSVSGINIRRRNGWFESRL